VSGDERRVRAPALRQIGTGELDVQGLLQASVVDDAGCRVQLAADTADGACLDGSMGVDETLDILMELRGSGTMNTHDQ
jgi:hypothetical protein